MGLQWGHVFSDVEMRKKRKKGFFSCSLQWGHVFSDVEMYGLLCFIHPGDGASMGPRLFRRGNAVNSRSPVVFLALQWGHVFSDVEMLQRLLGVLRRCELQWGHVFSDVEIASRMMGCRRRCMASMGPRLFRRGNVFSAFGPVIASPASMGPRLFRRGNGRLRLYQRPRARRFNGATSFQTWKSGLR